MCNVNNSKRSEYFTSCPTLTTCQSTNLSVFNWPSNESNNPQLQSSYRTSSAPREVSSVRSLQILSMELLSRSTLHSRWEDVTCCISVVLKGPKMKLSACGVEECLPHYHLISGTSGKVQAARVKQKAYSWWRTAGYFHKHAEIAAWYLQNDDGLLHSLTQWRNFAAVAAPPQKITFYVIFSTFSHDVFSAYIMRKHDTIML